MVQLDLTHLASLALGVLLGAGALWAYVWAYVWAYGRRRAATRASSEAEGALRAKLQLATELAGVGVWHLDLATRKVTCDPTLQQLLAVPGVLDDGMLPVHPDDRLNTRAALRQVLESPEGSGSLRARVVHPDGTIRHIETYFRTLTVTDRARAATELVGVTRDISHEVEHANQQRALAERLNMATEAAGITCWQLDTQTRRFVWIENPHPEVLFGEPIDLSLDNYRERIDPDDDAQIRACLADARVNGKERVSYRYRIRGRSGRLLHVQTHARVLLAEDGGMQLLGVSWDITKEIEAAERLQQQAQMLRDVERRLERASLSSSEGHWEKDMVSGTLWFSSSYHTLLGYQPGELSNAPDAATERFHPDDISRARHVFRQHVKYGTPFDLMMRLQMKNGEYRWFRHRGMVERDEHGKPRSMAGSIQDAHEQKLAEDALRHTQQRLERAIKGTQDGLWEMDVDGSSWHSPRVAELLGYTEGELPPGSNFLQEFLHPDDVETIAAASRVHFQQRLPYDVEIRLRTRSGEYRWYRARATAERDADGRPLRLSGSLQDVTEARSAREALLQATEAAESANRAKSEFLANVSHEIRTPMNGIIGMTGLLLESPLDRTQRDYAETIRSSADSLLIVINDILDFSKIEAGKLDIEAIELDLRDIAEEVGVMLAFQAAAKNLELVVHIHPNVPNRVVGDPQRIRQCLINLVSNAIKFTREGEIVVEVSVETVDGRQCSHFEVRDTGIGIAPGTLQNLFQPFVQADSSTTRHFGGTGLGLSIVRRLVQMMGGDVGAHSELNKGSRFWFTVPLTVATQTAPPAPPPQDLTRLGRRVLVVDDNETNRRVLAGQLIHAGFEVSLAGGGIEAMSLLHAAAVDGHPFEVVLADHRMHDMDGAALGERINADRQLSQARLVMLTSVDGHGDIHRFAALGFAAYLTKPIRTRELLKCLDRVLAHDSRQWHMQSQPIVTRNTLAPHLMDAYRGTVLLVEDNAVNQKVAVRFLERMGCTVRVADNGVEAVRACEETTFDLVLMDLQMPVMDGITASQRIRERETGDGRPNVPIVALTANAMASQLERCMDAGMNAFLTKPLEIPRLHEVLTRFGLRVTPEDIVVSHADIASNDVPVDLSRLNELTDGDPEFIRELAETFIASGEQVLEEARAALAMLDRVNLSRIAHKLKGASANVHAGPLRNLAHTLETQAASLDQASLAELVTQLAGELQRAKQFFAQYTPPAAARTG
ncbi:MAG TPA: PAS domain-containing protein [Steroidobacter sp.]|uniref:PAS domain-containing protein n=1 Tax=Steroidobacter sp. TaxID=1978227 RepID=UPI002ED7C5D0